MISKVSRAASAVLTACLFVSALAACGDDDGDAPAARGAQIAAPPTSSVCAGEAHTCVMKASGEVLCTGMNLDGQLGDGTTVERHGFVPVVGVRDAKQLDCGANHSCVVRASGSIACWGKNHHAELGDGSTSPTAVPVEVKGITGAAEVGAGDGYTCARLTSGAVSCWGDGRSGRLGNGDVVAAAQPSPVLGLADALSVSVGDDHVCVIRAGGTVACWGEGSSYELGRGDEPRDATEPVTVDGIEGAVAVGAGGKHSCAATGDGVFCWGANGNGELGDEQGGAGKRSGTPLRVIGLSGASALALGPVSSCALLPTGDVSCWGHNGGAAQRLGVGSDESMVLAPKALVGGRDIVSLDLARSHGCALSKAGAVSCWGSVYGGQLGAYEGDAATPVTIVEDLAKLSAEPSSVPTFAKAGDGGTPERGLVAGDRHFCGVEPGGRVRCFGDAGEGQLGTGSTQRGVSESVQGMTDAVAVAAGIDRACALRAGGEVACWGRLGPQLSTSSPVPVAGIDDARALAVGGDAHGILACVIHEDGGVSCWSHLRRRGGASVSAAAGQAPTRVEGLTGALELAVGLSSACARTDEGVVCWGDNSQGQLGNGSTTSSSSPVAVRGLSKVSAIAADAYGYCAVHARGAVSCWGDNRRGQLGTGSVGGSSSTARAVRGLSGVTQLALGGGTACALGQSGVRCWGANELGQGGGGSAEPRDITKPRAVVQGELGAYVDYACGTGVCCGLHDSGSVSCVGSGSFLDGGAADVTTPTEVPGVSFAAEAVSP